MKKHTYWFLLGIIMASFIGCKEVTPESGTNLKEVKQQESIVRTIESLETVSMQAADELYQLFAHELLPLGN